MIREGIAVLIIVALLILVYLRKKHYGYVLAAAPLAIIPAVHLLINLVMHLNRGRFFGIRPAVVMAFTDLLALVATCVVIVIIGQRMALKRSRNIYIGFMLAYSIILGWAFIYENLEKLFP